MPTKGNIGKKSESSPLNSLLNLNLQIIKNLSQIEITDFVNKPDKLLENQIKIAISNSILFLEYMKQSWEIFARMIPEPSSATSDIQQRTNFLKVASSFLTTPDVLIGNITKSLFSPAVDTDPLDILKSTVLSMSESANKSETPKSITEDAIKKMKRNGKPRVSH
ncbi:MULTISPECIES: hypothetical protein [Legionella]|uniref:Phasin protein n=1 Tax=Legionella drozanskii LLAP-1 TaxID=1212489 RepID=A0A0W0TC02_9GAMM|nr:MULTISPECIES: hypothetical protein [Legionella]KTC93135.1 hypothetical protein Ldro_0506 [Legionella drozanskii LLAP-1]PJE09362.1 MAG: hypothetical protein CK430_11255 [Legionella sp.]